MVLETISNPSFVEYTVQYGVVTVESSVLSPQQSVLLRTPCPERSYCQWYSVVLADAKPEQALGLQGCKQLEFGRAAKLCAACHRRAIIGVGVAGTHTGPRTAVLSCDVFLQILNILSTFLFCTASKSDPNLEAHQSPLHSSSCDQTNSPLQSLVTRPLHLYRLCFSSLLLPRPLLALSKSLVLSSHRLPICSYFIHASHTSPRTQQCTWLPLFLPLPLKHLESLFRLFDSLLESGCD